MEAIDKNVGKKFQKSYFDVLGLFCSSESPTIERTLSSLDGVKDFSVIVPTKTVIVVHDSLLISQIQIVKALNRARLEANVRVHGEPNYKNKWPRPYAIISSVLLLLSFLKYIYSPLGWLAIGAVAMGVLPILSKAVLAVHNLTLDINVLVVIAVSGSIALHDYWEAGTMVFLFTIAQWLESRASHKATAVMSSLVNVVPQRAVLADTGEEINADEVMLNMVLAVKAGEVIPIDGIVVDGGCEVDEKFLTGESFPVAKEKDSLVWAGTINLNGYITVKTTAIAEDCVVARTAKLVEDARNKKSRTQRFMDKCAKYYAPAILAIAAFLVIVPVAFRVRNKKEWYQLALVVLVSGCPCALVLSTPVAMFCALSKAARLGVLFKGTEHLESLAHIKIMAFDKTGTITRGEFLVADFISLQDNVSLSRLLYWISSIESKSSHPMAAALIDFARAHAIEPKPEKVEKFQIFPGEGICGRIEDKDVYVGNWKVASRAGCTAVPKLEGYDIEGKSIGYIFLGSSPAGIFCLSDACRTGAKEALEELKSMGIKTVMLTGDSYTAAKHAQSQLAGILDVVHVELLPEDKVRIIKELQKEGPTAMTGDGFNDAPALSAAEVGISMGINGSALATETGDIVLMSNDIQRIPKALRTAKRVQRKIIENVIIAISTKAAVLGLAIAGHPLVWAAVLTDVGTCLLVIFNSMLLLQGTPTQAQKCHRSTTNANVVQKQKRIRTPGCSSSTDNSPCFDVESQYKCQLQSCSSKKCSSDSISCGEEKRCSAADEHDCDANCHLLHEAKVMDHQDLESEILPMHDDYSSKTSCCKENSCSRSAERHNNDGLHDRVVEEQKFEHKGSSNSSHGCSEKVSCCKKVVESAERRKNGSLYDTLLVY
ncbi:putative inactive cadmium/zinc-transporting ATPase HMA3 [Sesamum indicum]|uniref:Inactive cadmium/zinc-transporting ATPase HMA3 n=1 Tax=Sesamum indicum TaxID=4182 RepID=A0A6I9U8U9_SESIN|nr:putative inactive cadmium/zinc-transporting ATPase HMA3 [Sesamum indicum]